MLDVEVQVHNSKNIVDKNSAVKPIPVAAIHVPGLTDLRHLKTAIR